MDEPRRTPCDFGDEAAHVPSLIVFAQDEAMAIGIGIQDAIRFRWLALPARSRATALLRMAVRYLIGLSAPLPLSNQRLELLRLLACLARRGDARLAEISARLIAVGMAPELVHAVIFHASPAARERMCT